MTTEPAALFKHGLTQKPDKPALRKVLMPDNRSFSQQQIQESIVFTINSRALLHRLRWVKDIPFGGACSALRQVHKKDYGFCLIVSQSMAGRFFTDYVE